MLDVLPWIGPSCSRHHFSILVVSPNKLYTEFLSKALYDVHLELNNRWQLSVHTSNDVTCILEQLGKIGPISIDFVVICMDTSKIQCIQWTKEILTQCDSDLRPGRTVLVNGSGLPTLEMAVPFDQITAIKREYKLQLLNGNLLIKSDIVHTARRVHIIIKTVMGLKTGLPYTLN